MNDLDVVVVGGGPAGATVATLCARQGKRVVLYEHRRFPRHKVCGDVINSNCWPVLERTGVADAIRALPHHTITGACFVTGDGATLDVPMRAVTVRRSLLDLALLNHARKSGVTVIEGEAVHEIKRDWPAVIGADGRNSIAARKGAAAIGPVAVQGHFQAPASVDDRVQLFLFEGGYAGLVRVDAGLVNLCIVTDAAGAKLREDCEALFARTVWRNAGFRALGIAPEPVEPLLSAAPLRRAMNVPLRDGVFLVGDALRVTEPFTGQGIFFALRTAELASAAMAGEIDYAAAVRALYRQRGRANGLLWRWLYRPRAAAGVMAGLRRWPAAREWLAANVLAGERATSR